MATPKVTQNAGYGDLMKLLALVQDPDAHAAVLDQLQTATEQHNAAAERIAMAQDVARALEDAKVTRREAEAFLVNAHREIDERVAREAEKAAAEQAERDERNTRNQADLRERAQKLDQRDKQLAVRHQKALAAERNAESLMKDAQARLEAAQKLQADYEAKASKLREAMG